MLEIDSGSRKRSVKSLLAIAALTVVSAACASPVHSQDRYRTYLPDVRDYFVRPHVPEVLRFIRGGLTALVGCRGVNLDVRGTADIAWPPGYAGLSLVVTDLQEEARWLVGFYPRTSEEFAHLKFDLAEALPKSVALMGDNRIHRLSLAGAVSRSSFPMPENMVAELEFYRQC